VAYEAVGSARSLLEAAAAKGFHFVSHPILDLILKDMQDPMRVKKHQDKVSRIIEKRQHEWGWSSVDVARALIHVLPGAKPQKNVRKAPADNDKTFVWDDIPSIAAALQAHGVSAVADATSAPEESKATALFHALAVVQQRGEETPARKSTLACLVCACVCVRGNAASMSLPLPLPLPLFLFPFVCQCVCVSV
jgi:hypothetical protein